MKFAAVSERHGHHIGWSLGRLALSGRRDRLAG
jgi:hypothetical protein